MLADLDLLLIAVFCAADDLLPEKPGNARRRLTDAEVVTLCAAQAIMGIPSDERFIAEFARHSPGWEDDLLLVDSTPVECARSLETTRRSALGAAADYGYCT